MRIGCSQDENRKNKKEFKMSIVINTNLAYLRAANEFYAASDNINTSLARLTSGLRVNSAADDPAGYYFASNINSQLSGMQVASSNIQMGYNIAETAAGDLQIINDQIERIKDLATQASSGTINADQKSEIVKEVEARLDEINRIAKESSFSDIKLLDGSIDNDKGVRIQIGANADSSTNAIYITDVFVKTDTDALNITGSAAAFATIEEAFATASSAAQFIGELEAASDIVKVQISNAGVAQNRMEAALETLNVKYQNYTAAYSTVMETDIAEETQKYTRYVILQQTAAAMMSQANSRSAIALSLLPQ